MPSRIPPYPPALSLSAFLDQDIKTIDPNAPLSEPKCTICLASYHGNDNPIQIRNVSGCNHIFGRSCLGLWLRDNNTCPMCRATLYEHPTPRPILNAFTRHSVDPRSTHTQDLLTLPNLVFEDISPRLRATIRQAHEQQRQLREMQHLRIRAELDLEREQENAAQHRLLAMTIQADRHSREQEWARRRIERLEREDDGFRRRRGEVVRSPSLSLSGETLREGYEPRGSRRTVVGVARRFWRKARDACR